MVGNNEKMKMKHPISFCFPPQIFWKYFSPYPVFLENLSSPLKKEWETVKTDVFLSKSLGNII